MAVNNMTQAQTFGYFYSMCKKHPGCEGCMLVGGTQVNTGTGSIVCETGKNKGAKTK